MKTAFVIFNGIQFPFYLVDHAIDWAAKNGGSLHGLFIHSNKEPPEGYIFPSDIDPAENIYGKEEAEKGNENVIHTQIKLFTDMMRSKNISVTTRELINPSLDDISGITGSADIVFVDAAFDKAYLLAATGFNLKHLKTIKSPLEVVSDNR
ncbi:MAG TPA: hypothetical protein VI461_01930 [Chitinophagaceae bacterium]|nr:hypothetical protein [Chitinophagaceae bacterium]